MANLGKEVYLNSSSNSDDSPSQPYFELSQTQTFANGLGKKVLQHINYISRGVERFAREETLKVSFSSRNFEPKIFLCWEKFWLSLFRTNGTGLQRCLSEYFSSFLLFLVPQQLYYLRGDEKKPQVLKMPFYPACAQPQNQNIKN